MAVLKCRICGNKNRVVDTTVLFGKERCGVKVAVRRWVNALKMKHLRSSYGRRDAN